MVNDGDQDTSEDPHKKMSNRRRKSHASLSEPDKKKERLVNIFLELSVITFNIIILLSSNKLILLNNDIRKKQYKI